MPPAGPVSRGRSPLPALPAIRNFRRANSLNGTAAPKGVLAAGKSRPKGPESFRLRPHQSAVRAEAIRGRERCPRHSGYLAWNALDHAKLRHSAHHFQPEHSGQRSRTDFSAHFGWRQGKLGGFHPVGWISTWLHSAVYIRWWEPLWFQRWFPQLFPLWFRERRFPGRWSRGRWFPGRWFPGRWSQERWSRGRRFPGR